MIATIDTMDLLDGSDELAEMVIQSDIFQNYRAARDQLNQNKESQAKIDTFKNIKLLHEEVQRFGKYHPDYRSISSEIRVAKRELDMDEFVVAFKSAETELETLLNELSSTIAHMVSTSIKVPTGNPFFDSMSCSGGCGSGKGCSCG
ncbi:ComK regulator [Bacillus sp. JCM 19046]|uniref:Cell fate (Sporulation/competence/biofilm development) regulator YlbF (YheA/YmcA/DUF963 family) n=1 Tax=Shouchella xiaoxiensis TaxID=766895 RepID=A0ABS2SPS8_9BACI|nr:YlbF family regulator [Shouchella xiaoxiensis]MBM7837532.1 cell fate (sporulation/competence/biofilm development) regulator YlbF (YheA/YmcA/DUF963 family) [Shouchella xiaoxiensis]GAF14625.1 ComK regulator [Bacillus sp. JCM 19045]GAF16497.1 ComK regulator [Bacillus sp. JCM 19046]